jgi:DNA modification methylase
MNQVRIGDASAQLAILKAEGVRVQMCVTSPPYFGLRNYNVDGQLGLEATPDEYVANLVSVLRGVREILANDGVLFLNLGDSYARAATKGQHKPGQSGGKHARVYDSGVGRASAVLDLHTGSSDSQVRRAAVPDLRSAGAGLKEKDLIGIPWMVAFALRADGWYLRQDIIWHKPNPMPESVTDRCTKSHEYLFLLTKSPRYFYDHEAIKEPVTDSTKARLVQNIAGQAGTTRANGGTRADRPLKAAGNTESRNKRDVWTIATRGYKGAHFAVFPPALVEPCILAGTSAAGHCPDCGKRWVRDVVKTPMQIRRTDRADALGEYGRTAVQGTMIAPASSITRGWKAACTCGSAPVPDIVLDPFFGSGTTGQVALAHGRQYLGIELNSDYVPLQQERLTGERS